MNFKDFLKANPELVLREEDTGGGCSALRLELGENYSVLITQVDDPTMPQYKDTEVMVGYYDNDEIVNDPVTVQCDNLSAVLLTLAIKSIL